MNKKLTALILMLPLCAYSAENAIPAECNDLFNTMDELSSLFKEKQIAGMQTPEEMAEMKAEILEGIKADPTEIAQECKQTNDVFVATLGFAKAMSSKNEQSSAKTENKPLQQAPVVTPMATDDSESDEFDAVDTSNDGGMPEIKNQNNSKLKYLYFSDAGLVGYFDDGSVVECPQCDKSQKSLETLSKAAAKSRFTEKEGVLLVDAKKEERPAQSLSFTEGWALINYEWVMMF